MFATIIDYVVSVVTQTINLLGVPVVINELAELYTEHKYSFKWLHRHRWSVVIAVVMVAHFLAYRERTIELEGVRTASAQTSRPALRPQFPQFPIGDSGPFSVEINPGEWHLVPGPQGVVFD